MEPSAGVPDRDIIVSDELDFAILCHGDPKAAIQAAIEAFPQYLFHKGYAWEEEHYVNHKYFELHLNNCHECQAWRQASLCRHIVMPRYIIDDDDDGPNWVEGVDDIVRLD